jgi:hypothetical protein
VLDHTAIVRGRACVHSFITPDSCGRNTFTRRTHGWLCKPHYFEEQASIPPKPRKPSERWLGYRVAQPQTDAEIVADIISADRQAIGIGRVIRVQRGTTDPIYLQLLEPPVVH